MYNKDDTRRIYFKREQSTVYTPKQPLTATLTIPLAGVILRRWCACPQLLRGSKIQTVLGDHGLAREGSRLPSDWIFLRPIRCFWKFWRKVKLLNSHLLSPQFESEVERIWHMTHQGVQTRQANNVKETMIVFVNWVRFILRAGEWFQFDYRVTESLYTPSEGWVLKQMGGDRNKADCKRRTECCP